jgi:hypothetical protein
MSIEDLMLSKSKAAKYLGCSTAELVGLVQPDRILPMDAGPPGAKGMRIWSVAALDAAKAHVEARREQNRIAAEKALQERADARAEIAAKRKGMRKGGALLAGKVCDALACTRAELDRWAGDGRFPPSGEIVLNFGRAIACRAWLPDAVAAAKDHVAKWREQDAIRRAARRRPLKIV